MGHGGGGSSAVHRGCEEAGHLEKQPGGKEWVDTEHDRAGPGHWHTGKLSWRPRDDAQAQFTSDKGSAGHSAYGSHLSGSEMKAHISGKTTAHWVDTVTAPRI